MAAPRARALRQIILLTDPVIFQYRGHCFSMGGTDTMMVVKVQRPGEKVSSPGISSFLCASVPLWFPYTRSQPPDTISKGNRIDTAFQGA